MKPKIRKVNTNKRKRARKDAQATLEKQASLIATHPTECCICERPFERTAETVVKWQVVVNEDRVRLTCPPCWEIVTKALENEE
jgi:hypothetical protein